MDCGRICFWIISRHCGKNNSQLEYPDAYQTTIPSISGTARHGLASTVFTLFMGASGALIIYATYVWHLFNVSCIRQTGHLTKKFITLSRCVLLIGTIVGLSVILMATVSLETSNLGHIIFSASTFTTLGLRFYLTALYWVTEKI